MSKLYSHSKFLAALLSCLLLFSCHGTNEETTDTFDEDLDPDVETPAAPLLDQIGSFHRLTVEEFVYDAEGVVDDDIMRLIIDNFTPSDSSNEPDEDDLDQSENHLGYDQSIWNEVNYPTPSPTLEWATQSSPLLDSKYLELRQYMTLDNGVLSELHTQLFQPEYETIDENIYERHQAAVFVWDFGGTEDIEASEDVSFQDIDAFQTESLSGFNYTVLGNASTWGQDYSFSNGAIIYGATRNVAQTRIVIEAAYDGSDFDIGLNNFTSGNVDLDDAISGYSTGVETRLEYKYTFDFFNHKSIYIRFDTSAKVAYLAPSSSTTIEDSIEAPYEVTVINEALGIELLEIDISGINKAVLDDSLNELPSYFNPIIAGPFGDELDYYYGKKYIETTTLAQRLKLEPLFFLNDIAIDDVMAAFEEWRFDRHAE